MMEKCWSNNPSERPSFQEIFMKLAFNIDINDKENKQEYYLDGVDVDKVLSYAYSIDASYPFITFKAAKKLTDENLNNFIEDIKKGKFQGEIPAINDIELIKTENKKCVQLINKLNDENKWIHAKYDELNEKNDLLIKRIEHDAKILNELLEDNAKNKLLIQENEAIKKVNERIMEDNSKLFEENKILKLAINDKKKNY